MSWPEAFRDVGLALAGALAFVGYFYLIFSKMLRR